MPTATYYAARLGVGEFLDWAGAYSPLTQEPEKFTCLFDVLEAWLNNGTAVDGCCHDYPTFLAAVTLIIARWHVGFQPKEDWPELYRITQILDEERPSYAILQPDSFLYAQQVQRDGGHR